MVSPESKPTITLPNGEVVAAPEYTIRPIEEVADAIIRTVGTKLLPSNRRSIRFFEPRPSYGDIPDPRDPGYNPNTKDSEPTPRP